MTENQIAKCRQRLDRFLAGLLEPIGRSERRHWGELYVRGLLQDGGRKSIEPIAARLPDGNVQAMQQFVGQSPWEWAEVWARLGKRMTAELEPDSAWAVDDTGFPNQGGESVGVERQYSGTLGKTGSCQVAVSLHHVGEQGNAVLGWRLYLPETWAKDKERREAAGIPEEVVFKKKWELALEVIDEVRGWGVPDRIVLADAGYGEATEFRDALQMMDSRPFQWTTALHAGLKEGRDELEPHASRNPQVLGGAFAATFHPYHGHDANEPQFLRDLADTTQRARPNTPRGSFRLDKTTYVGVDALWNRDDVPQVADTPPTRPASAHAPLPET